MLYENLTVSETLYYAAMLRLPRTMTKEEKVGRVDAVIDTLGLFKCKDTIIGEGSGLITAPLLLFRVGTRDSAERVCQSGQRKWWEFRK